MADKIAIEKLPPFFQKKIKALDNMRDEDLFYGKELMKGIYTDAYLVAKHCGSLDEWVRFSKAGVEEQYRLVPELKDSGHSGISFSGVLFYAKKYLEVKDLPLFFQDKLEELDQKPDDEVLYGKDLVKQIYLDAYAIAKYCGNVPNLETFAAKKTEEQNRLVPQLEKSGHSSTSLSWAIGCAKEFLENEQMIALQKMKQGGRTGI